MAARVRAITKYNIYYLLSHFELFLLTCDNQGVDGNTVVFVLFVWVRASQAQPGQEGPKEVKEEADDDQSCCAADIAWRTERELEHLADCCCC